MTSTLVNIIKFMLTVFLRNNLTADRDLSSYIFARLRKNMFQIVCESNQKGIGELFKLQSLILYY